MRKLFVLLFVAVFVLLLLAQVAPAKAAAPTIEAQYCAWYNHQFPVVSTFGGWSIYDVNPVCARGERLVWLPGGDARPSYGPGTLAQWAAGK